MTVEETSGKDGEATRLRFSNRGQIEVLELQCAVKTEKYMSTASSHRDVSGIITTASFIYPDEILANGKLKIHAQSGKS